MSTENEPREVPKSRLIELLKIHVEISQGRLAAFKKRFEENPADALDACDSTFEHAAAARVYGYVHRALTADDSKATTRSVAAHAERMMRGGARCPKRSTSATANFFHQMETAAWTQVYEWAIGEEV